MKNIKIKFPKWLIPYSTQLKDKKSHDWGSNIIMELLSKNMDKKIVVLINNEPHSVALVNNSIKIIKE